MKLLKFEITKIFKSKQRTYVFFQILWTGQSLFISCRITQHCFIFTFYSNSNFFVGFIIPLIIISNKVWKLFTILTVLLISSETQGQTYFGSLWEQLLRKTEAATRGVLYEKVLLHLLQNSQESTCVRVSF